ncbi:MAG: acetate--CoA ligase family protein, partial [Novosphingobium sp.]|nr:acetate--CoA ligase family protein [Novosphingobium sp.]
TQYGLGRNGICLDSTLHERESGLGVSSSRDKATSASILRRIGLPAMHHTFARNADHAVQIARQLKYPVVVKPSSLDGGLGVEADLRSDEEVRQAFAKALKYTPKILVEKWVPGRDYRMVVLNNKLVWAVERVPGGVTGDGRSTIAELVEIENRDPNRGPSPDLPMNLLEIDDEATLVLEREGLTTQSVPQAGAFVRLRRAANVSRGGRPVAVFDKVHPDNAALAVEAANAMWLDLAGVDLILPDITKSWRETGGVVCEVNSQPQLGGLTSAHLFPLVLETFTRNRGAIPVCCVAGADRASALSEMIAGQLSARGAQVGLNLPDTIKVGSDRIREGSVPILQAGNILSWRRTIDAMVLGVWDTSVLQTGLPVPALDLLVLSGENIPTVDDLISHMLPMLAPSARKVVVVATPDDCDPEILKVLKTEGIAHSFVTQDDLLSLVRNISDSYPQTPEAGAALQ